MTNTPGTPRYKQAKARVPIFNFPLSEAVRSQIEELATLWDVSLAAAIRRSIDAAYNNAEIQEQAPKESAKQSKIAILETLIAIHTDLAATKANTAKILAAISVDQEHNK